MNCFFKKCASKIQRGSGLKPWGTENMIQAIKAVYNKERGYLAAAKIYTLPRSTLHDYVRSNLDPLQATQSKLERKPIIPPVLEEKFVEYLQLTELKYFGHTRDDVRRLAFEVAVQNKIPRTFSVAIEAPGKHWFKLDVHGSVHRNINLIEKLTKCDRVVEFIIPVFHNCSTCFGRHTAHYQELKNCNYQRLKLQFLSS
jgi:hypothetical protein